MTILLSAASLLIAAARPGRPCAAEGAVLSSITASQVDPDSLGPSASGQVVPAPYQMEQNSRESEPPGLKEYLASSGQISLLGISLRIDERRAEQEIQGLLVVDVAPGSPGAQAGLHPFHQPIRDIVNGASMLATMMFPPAVIVGTMVGSIPLPESYDLIIGVDGSRVTNFVNFYECMRDVQPGEIVYLNILRNGHRLQLQLRVPTSLPPAQSWVR